jgi:hypothetical protein
MVSVISDTPGAMLASVAEQVLGPALWVGAELQAVFGGAEVSSPFMLYTDGTYSTKWDVQQPTHATCIRIKTKGGETLRIIAALRPKLEVGRWTGYVADDQRPIFLLETHAARHQDGTVQIYGAEPGLAIFTIEAMREAFREGKTLIDTDSMESFSIEQRGPDGAWTGGAFAIALGPELFREVRE